MLQMIWVNWKEFIRIRFIFRRNIQAECTEIKMINFISTAYLKIKILWMRQMTKPFRTIKAANFEQIKIASNQALIIFNLRSNPIIMSIQPIQSKQQRTKIINRWFYHQWSIKIETKEKLIAKLIHKFRGEIWWWDRISVTRSTQMMKYLFTKGKIVHFRIIKSILLMIRSYLKRTCRIEAVISTTKKNILYKQNITIIAITFHLTIILAISQQDIKITTTPLKHFSFTRRPLIKRGNLAKRKLQFLEHVP